MMKNIIYFLLLSLHYVTLGQTKFGNEWNIGLYGYQVKFENMNLIHDTTYLNHSFWEGLSNICDSSGNILLCSDGFNIYDSSGTLLDGGDTLVPIDYFNYYDSSPCAQTSIFLPMAGRKYYFVTPSPNDTMFANWFIPAPVNKAPFNLLMYNVVDMNANGGLGKVTARMIPLIENHELSKTQMMACRHANGKDWWLLKMAGDSNMVYTFLFTQDTVFSMEKQYIPFPFRGYFDVGGQMVFSQDGSKWASTYSSPYAEVYYGDFDRCTGQLSNLQKLAIPPQPTGLPPGYNQADTANSGLCFSPDGNILYISRYSHIMQYHLQNHSLYKVYGFDTAFAASAGYANMLIGPDNKIYIGNWSGTSKQMSVIDNPDIQGVGCNFCRKCLRSKSSYGYLKNVPCMPNYELGEMQPCWPLAVPPSPLGEGRGEALEVYPNPARTILSVKISGASPSISGQAQSLGIELYNAMGQLLLTTSNTEIDVSKYSSGVYYIKAGGMVRKVVIE